MRNFFIAVHGLFTSQYDKVLEIIALGQQCEQSTEKDEHRSLLERYNVAREELNVARHGEKWGNILRDTLSCSEDSDELIQGYQIQINRCAHDVYEWTVQVSNCANQTNKAILERRYQDIIKLLKERYMELSPN